MSDVVITQWTGWHAYALQRACRKTNEQFAEQLGLAVRTVARWHSDDVIVPRNEVQQILDLALSVSNSAVKARFAEFIRSDSEPAPVAPQAGRQPQSPPAADPVVAQMAADMALMQARIDSLQEKLGALALRVLT